MTDLAEVHTERYSPRDTLSREGAKELAFILRAHWEKRGFTVLTSIEHGVALGRLGFYAVRSDMIGGFPRSHPMVNGVNP